MHKMSRRTFLKLCTSALVALGLERYIPAAAASRTIQFPRQIITARAAPSCGRQTAGSRMHPLY